MWAHVPRSRCSPLKLCSSCILRAYIDLLALAFCFRVVQRLLCFACGSYGFETAVNAVGVRAIGPKQLVAWLALELDWHEDWGMKTGSS